MEKKAAGKMTSGVRKQREMNAVAQPTPYLSNQGPQPIGCGPYIQSGLLSSVSLNTFKDSLRLCFLGNFKSSQVDQKTNNFD